MRRLGAAVCLVAAGDERTRAGLTATAVMSLTAEPPQIGAAVNRSTGAFSVIQASGRFSIYVLALAQLDVAIVFSAGTPDERRAHFASPAWDIDAQGTPMLRDAMASCRCRTVQAVHLGTHALFCGRVEAIHLSHHTIALMHGDGTWSRLAPISPPGGPSLPLGAFEKLDWL